MKRAITVESLRLLLDAFNQHDLDRIMGFFSLERTRSANGWPLASPVATPTPPLQPTSQTRRSAKTVSTTRSSCSPASASSMSRPGRGTVRLADPAAR
jgi:hypothetical protein